jgi:hypothetical protein
MSYTIPPGSPKSVKAAAFGRELVKACKTRGIPFNGLERAIGTGHSSLDNYRRGLILPKVETAKALAAVLDWPRLATMIVEARTFVCARHGCGRTFRNDTGAPRRYCTAMCLRINANLRIAEQRMRRAGQSGDARTRAAAMRRLKSGLAIADERSKLLESAIAGMCEGCEPEGICHTVECPLRPFSPLPIAVHLLRIARPMTDFETRSAGWTPERRARHSELMRNRWADPAWAGPQREKLLAKARSETPEHRAARVRKVSATKRAKLLAERRRPQRRAS